MKNQVKLLREKLFIYGEIIITRQILEKLIDKFAPSYKISDLTLKGLITPVKRGKIYINNLSDQEQDAYRVIDTYFEGEDYMIGGLEVYNTYGFSTQVTEWYTVYNTKVSGKRHIGKNKFIFKKQVPSFFYGYQKKKQTDFHYIIMTPERALIQMIKDGSSIEKLPDDINLKKLLSMSKKYSSKRVYDKISKLCI